MCLFDRGDRTVLWNATFLTFFPEHAGHVHRGEHYRENLHRFYSARLPANELPNIQRYIDDGIARHHAQMRPFIFSHRGRQLRVAAGPGAEGGRLRIWQSIGAPDAASNEPSPAKVSLDLLELIPDGATILNAEGRLIAANNEFRTLYDVPPERPIAGLTLAQIARQAWAAAGYQDAPVEVAFLDNLRFVGAPFEVELPGGRWRRVIARTAESGASYFIHTDITQLKRALADLAAMAMTDGLTGLLNRRRFEQSLTDEYHRVERLGMPLSLMLVDVDRFKEVNDTHGHPVGDACLVRIAAIINTAIRRPSDMAARLGGDEFAVLLPNTDAVEARVIADRISRRISAETWGELHPGLQGLGVSIGVCAATPAARGSAAELINVADSMLYEVKRTGRGSVKVLEVFGGEAKRA